MSQPLSRKWRSFWYKVTHWEFWSFNVLYFPVNFYFVWLALRSRSFFFFTAANPTIDFGGMLGESKSEIYKLIPQSYLPLTYKISAGDLDTAQAKAELIGFPLICKPDKGERGKLVEKIKTAEQLIAYVKRCPVDFLIQAFVDLPIELGVFFIKHPDQTTGQITSIVQKDFMHVIGDGTNTVMKLLEKLDRAQIQLDFQHPRFSELMREVPAPGQKVLVESIGNHCRGTIFLDSSFHITPALQAAFNEIANNIPGFHFGRFDMRCVSFEKLEKLEDFKILELNGAGAEPAHIYHPGNSLWNGYRDIFWHLAQLGEISRKNHQMGIDYWTFRKGWRKLQAIKQYNKHIESAL